MSWARLGWCLSPLTSRASALFAAKLPLVRGSTVALVTPMKYDGSIDYDKYEALLKWHISEGIGDGLEEGGALRSLRTGPCSKAKRAPEEFTGVQVKWAAGTVGSITHQQS